MEIWAVANHKGGSGKTTTVYYLARLLAEAGKRVLCIDLDDQGTLTSARCAVSTYGQPTIAEVLDGLRDANDIRVWGSHGIELVPADYRLAWMAAKLQGMSPNHAFLAEALDNLAGFDVVLLDCPPSAGVLLVNALAVADGVLVPGTPTVESWDGYQHMRTMIADVRRKLRHDVDLLGVVVVQAVTNSKSHHEYLQRFAETGDYLGVIPQRTGVDADLQLLNAYRHVLRRLIVLPEAEDA